MIMTNDIDDKCGSFPQPLPCPTPHLRIVKAHEVVSSKGAKQLKGVDKEKVSRLSDQVCYAVRLVIETSLKNEVFPYLTNIQTALKDDKMSASKLPSMFSESSPVFGIRKTVYVAAVEAFVNACGGLSNTLKKLDQLSELDAVASQSILQQWQKDSYGLIALFDPAKAAKSFNIGAEAAFYQKFHDQLENAINQTSSIVESCLSGNVHSEAHKQIIEVIRFMLEVLKYEETVKDGKKDDTSMNVDKFTEHLETCCRLTSVMGDEGKKIRHGMKVLECAAKCSYNFAAASAESEHTSVDKLVDEAEMEAIKICYTVFSPTKRETAIKDLAFLFQTVKETLPSELSSVEANIVTLLDGMVKKSKDCVVRVAASLDTAFKAVQKRGDFEIELPDAINGVSDMVQLTSPEFRKIVAATFPTAKSSLMVEIAVGLETIESSVETIQKEIGMPVEEIAPWIADCKTMRCRFLSWLFLT